MTQDVQLLLDKFMFPVDEREVAIVRGKNGEMFRETDYKAIVRSDTSELISIQKSSYQLVRNSDIINPLLAELNLLDTPWFIDKSHSYVDNKRMRIMVTYPQLVFHDGQSDICLSLFIENSADGTISVRSYVGGIRGRCSNGMVFGQILEKYYHKHTNGFCIDNLKQTIHSLYEKIPVIKHRVEQLQNTRVTKELRQQIENKLGKKVYKYVEEQEREIKKSQNQWILYNLLTYYISHLVKQQLRAKFQQDISKLFKL